LRSTPCANGNFPAVVASDEFSCVCENVCVGHEAISVADTIMTSRSPLRRVIQASRNPMPRAAPERDVEKFLRGSSGGQIPS
jgi:hypothetical protein